MAKVNVCDVEVLDNPASFFDTFKFKITFECHEPLEDDLEWKVVYVGSAYNSNLDQTLDSILVGPIPVGRHQFVFEVEAPDPSKIPNEDVVGVTVVLIQALYREKEFIRIGYYVNNEYKSEELANEPPAQPLISELKRTVLTTDPRVTRFPIDWGDGLLDGIPEPEKDEVVEGDDEVIDMSADNEKEDEPQADDVDNDGDDNEANDEPEEDSAAEIDLEASDDEEDDGTEDEDEKVSEDVDDMEDDEADSEDAENDPNEADENGTGPEPMDADPPPKNGSTSEAAIRSCNSSPLKPL